MFPLSTDDILLVNSESQNLIKSFENIQKSTLSNKDFDFELNLFSTETVNQELQSIQVLSSEGSNNYNNSLSLDHGYKTSLLNELNIIIFSCEDTSPLFSENDLLSPNRHNNFPGSMKQSQSSQTIQDIIDSFLYLKLSPDLDPEFTNGLNSGSLYQGISEYTSSSKLSPFENCNHFSLSPDFVTSIRRKRLIEEIIETEETYINSLKLLSGFYLEPIISNGNNGIPIKQIKIFTDILIKNHMSFLKDLRSLYSIDFINNLHELNYSPGFMQEIQSLVSYSSPLMAASVAKLIKKKAISSFVYGEYRSIYGIVYKLLKSDKEDSMVYSSLTSGFQNFLEASQKEHESFDLSLMSLIQKPIQRLSKYKLFLKELVKLTSSKQDELYNKQILDCLIDVESIIENINAYKSPQVILNNLLKILQFGAFKLIFPIEYLGLPLILDALEIIWVEKDKKVQIEAIGAFLFKTHLIFAKITESGKFQVLFLIPLSVSKIISTETNINGGIFCSSDSLIYTFKIIFEHKYSIYEVLCFTSNEKDFNKWRECIDILINQVNGPYSLNYSSSKVYEDSGKTLSIILPPRILAFDKMFHQGIEKEYRDGCYFRDIIPLIIKSKQKSISKVLTHTKVPHYVQMIFFNPEKQERIKMILDKLWSEDSTLDSFISRKQNKVDLHKKSSISDNCISRIYFDHIPSTENRSNKMLLTRKSTSWLSEFWSNYFHNNSSI